MVSEGKVDGFTSSLLIAELEDVLVRPKFGLAVSQVAAIADLVRQTFLSVSPTERVAVIADDPDGDAVLEAALAANADLIISGDSHLLTLGEFRGTRIVSPAEFVRETDRRR
jgi:putative PIN family toxin of toxin-antitoxin system